MSGDTATSFGRTLSNTFYSPRWLFYTSKDLIFQRYATYEKIGENMGSTVRFKKLSPPSVPTDPIPLSEGVTPPPLNLSRTEVVCDIYEFGQWLQENNIMRDLFEDGKDLHELQAKTLSEYFVEENDKAIFNVISMGTNVGYSTGSARSSVVDVPTKSDLDLIARNMRNGLNGRAGKPITMIMKSDGRFGTLNIKPSFIIVIHVDNEHDFEQMEGFKPFEDYGQHTFEPGEIGNVGRFRIVSTQIENLIEEDSGGSVGSNNILSASGSNADVYKLMVISKDAYGCIAVGGKSGMQLRRKVIGSGGTDDPLDQRGTVGYRKYFAACILYQERLYRFECAATAVPGE